MNKKILEADLAQFANVSVRTIRRIKKNDSERYSKLIKKFMKSDIHKLREFLTAHNIELLGNFGIHFNDVDDYAVGILAEDTNNMITISDKSDELIEKIEDNLKLLKSWL